MYREAKEQGIVPSFYFETEDKANPGRLANSWAERRLGKSFRTEGQVTNWEYCGKRKEAERCRSEARRDGSSE